MKSKFLKTLSVSAIAAMMIAAVVPTTSFAAEEVEKPTLTVASSTGVMAGDEIKCYKVASLDTAGKYEWKWNPLAFVDNAVPSEVSAYNLNDENSVTNNNVKKLSALLSRSVDRGSTGIGKAMTLDNPLTLDDGEGYYLVVVTLGETNNSDLIYQPMLVEVKNGEKRVISETKASTIKFEKTITGVEASKDGLSGQTHNNNLAQVKIGDKISYQIVAQIPSYDPAIKDIDQETAAEKYVPFEIIDTPSRMTISRGSVKVYLSDDEVYDEGDKLLTSGENADYTLSLPTGAAKPLTITLNKDNVILKNDKAPLYEADNANKFVIVKLDATLDSTALIENVGNPNNAKLNYGNRYSTGGNLRTKEDQVKVFTTQLQIKKVDSKDSNTVLEGAKFSLVQTNESGDDVIVAENVTTDSNGIATIKGLSAGKYYLFETAAPAGYKLDTTRKEIIITRIVNTSTMKVTFGSENEDTANRESNKVGLFTNVVNIKGGELPGTGGIGTTIFMTVGASVVVLAGVMFIVYMRKRRNNNEE